MKINKLNEDKKNGKLSFLLKDSTSAFINTVRRLIMEEVPTLAVEDIEVKDNNSALYDELLGLRIGLVPIKTDLKSYVLKENCKCEGAGCAQCELKVNLKVTKKGMVLAEDAESSDPKCKFVYPNMPIVKLLAKQKVDLLMTAVMGKGKDHVKWSPGLVFYKREPVIEIGKVKDSVKVAERCPKNVFSAKVDKLAIIKENLYGCHLCGQCTDLDENITIGESNNFIFNLESWGQLSCKEILDTSAEILIAKVEAMESLI